MASETDAFTDDTVVRPCPMCPVRGIVAKGARECYHMTCGSCRSEYCGICGFVPKERGVFHHPEHRCVQGEYDEEPMFDIYCITKQRCDSIIKAYEDALA